MKQKIIISLFLFLGLIALASFINFNERSVEAAYFSNTLPTATTGQTLRFSGSEWESSSALSNDGTNVSAPGSITASSFLYSSDLRLKENIKSLDNSLEKIKALEGVSFNWIESGEAEIGLIAQDVETVLPELVVSNREGIKAVKYGNLVALLIEAVKEQQSEIEILKATVENLK